MMKEAGGIAHLLNVLGVDLHVLHRRGAAQLDRPLVELSCAAPARGHARALGIHVPELADGAGVILSRGLLEPWPCLLEVHSHTVALVVHHADLMLALSVTPLRSHLVRRHRPRVIDRHAFAPEEEVGDGRSCSDVALPSGACR